MSKSEQLEQLRRRTAEVQADPVAAFYDGAPPYIPTASPLPPPRIVDTGGYPIEEFNRFLREEAEHYQALSGEDSQC